MATTYFFDENHASRKSETNTVKTAILVSRQNCSEDDMGLPSSTSEKHRKQCIDTFKYASSIDGVVSGVTTDIIKTMLKYYLGFGLMILTERGGWSPDSLTSRL